MDDYIRFQYIHMSLELVHTYKSIATRTKQRNRTKFRSLSQAYLVIKPIGPRFNSLEKQTDANLSNTLSVLQTNQTVIYLYIASLNCSRPSACSLCQLFMILPHVPASWISHTLSPSLPCFCLLISMKSSLCLP